MGSRPKNNSTHFDFPNLAPNGVHDKITNGLLTFRPPRKKLSTVFIKQTLQFFPLAIVPFINLCRGQVFLSH